MAYNIITVQKLLIIITNNFFAASRSLPHSAEYCRNAVEFCSIDLNTISGMPHNSTKFSIIRVKTETCKVNISCVTWFAHQYAVKREFL